MRIKYVIKKIDIRLNVPNQIRVRNIWFLLPLVLSKWENLALSVCILFEKSVFIIQNWKINTFS